MHLCNDELKALLKAIEYIYGSRIWNVVLQKTLFLLLVFAHMCYIPDLIYSSYILDNG